MVVVSDYFAVEGYVVAARSTSTVGAIVPKLPYLGLRLLFLPVARLLYVPYW